LSGDYSVVVYYHDGKSYSGVANFVFLKLDLGIYLWMILRIVLISIILYIYYKWNKMRYIQKLKLREEELKHQKMILEMELKAENKLIVKNMKTHPRTRTSVQIIRGCGKSLAIAKQSEMIDNIENILQTENNLDQLKEIKKID
jgi:hypothetical protein